MRSTAVFVFRDRGFGWGDMGRGFFIRFFSAISALLRLGRSPVDRLGGIVKMEGLAQC